jgi:hypothetical protein
MKVDADTKQRISTAFFMLLEFYKVLMVMIKFAQ